MNIIGFVKNSFVDYPGKIASVIFTPGCNMNCWYCHNQSIIHENKNEYNKEKILNFLKERKGFIDGVVVSGGEPTLQPDLKSFITELKSMGFLVKLDTNGTNFETLKNLVQENLLDYVAMDIKAPLEKYSDITPINETDLCNVKKSIEFLKTNKVPYEFRTTFAPNLSVEDIKEIISYIGCVECYSLQCYQTPEHIKNDAFKNHVPSEFESLKLFGEQCVKRMNVKNI